MKKTVEIIGDIWSSRYRKEEQTLPKEVDTLQAVFNILSEGMIVADQNEEFLFFNPVAERILGTGVRKVTLAEWMSVNGCYYPDKVTPYPSDQLPLARAMRGEEVNEEVIYIKNPERPEGVWISASACPLKDGVNLVGGGIVIFRDITEQRIAQEKLERFNRAVEQTADSVIITDTQGVIEYVNPAFEATSGYSREEALGQTPRILRSGKHDKAFYNRLWKTIYNGQNFRGTIINKKKNGELYWSEQTITPMKDNEGNITNFVSVLKDITELKNRQKQEFRLSIAREVQERLYNGKASIPGFDIAGATYPAVETNGDYFDFISMPDGCLWIAVGDVSGHGIGAALIMATTRAYLRAFVKMETDPGTILTRLNQELVTDLDGERFVTLILARIDPHEHSLQYASAGHIPAYVLNSSGEVEYKLVSTGVPLGFMSEYKCDKSEAINLTPESIVAFLTDGITEAETPDETAFGFNRTLDFIKNNKQASARQIVERLYQKIRTFSENQPQEDDVTTVICKVNPIG